MKQANRIFGILVTCGILAVSAQTALSQTGPESPADRGPTVMKRGKPTMFGPDYRLDMMTRRLDLTQEQRSQIRPILAAEELQLQALRGNNSYNRDERRSRLQELNLATDEKIRPFLTPEQQAKHEEARNKISDNRSRNRNTRPGPNPGENDPDNRIKRLTLDLGLTDAQQVRIRPILEEESAQLELLRGNDSYDPEQRRTILLQLNQDSSDKVRQLLTPEQKKKHDDIQVKIMDRRTRTKNPNISRP